MPEHAACKLPEQENNRMRYGLNRNQLKYIAATAMLLDHIGSDSIAQILLREVPEDLRDKPLADTGLKNDRNIELFC